MFLRNDSTGCAFSTKHLRDDLNGFALLLGGNDGKPLSSRVSSYLRHS